MTACVSGSQLSVVSPPPPGAASPVEYQDKNYTDTEISRLAIIILLKVKEGQLVHCNNVYVHVMMW